MVSVAAGALHGLDELSLHRAEGERMKVTGTVKFRCRMLYIAGEAVTSDLHVGGIQAFASTHEGGNTAKRVTPIHSGLNLKAVLE